VLHQCRRLDDLGTRHLLEVSHRNKVLSSTKDLNPELRRRAVGAELEERRRQVADIAAAADDPFWAVMEWSVDADPNGVWPALVSAAAADVVPAVSQLVRAFDRWWTSLVARLVSDRLIDGLSKRDAADAIGIVAEGLLLPLDASNWSAARRHHLARTLISPLLRR
jgi:hypothetical protein